jgi:hypothetical protein
VVYLHLPRITYLHKELDLALYVAYLFIFRKFPRVFEKWVLRRIFGLKKDEVTGEWRKLHNEELRDLYSSLSIIRIIK